jgi:hypothetical protein
LILGSECILSCKCQLREADDTHGQFHREEDGKERGENMYYVISVQETSQYIMKQKMRPFEVCYFLDI